MNSPFDLSGPEFLQFFTVAFVFCLVGAFALRAFLCAPFGVDSSQTEHLGSSVVAYVAGGPPLAVQATLARLAHAGLIGPGDTSGTLKVLKPLPDKSSLMEKQVYLAVQDGTDPKSLHLSVREALETVHERAAEYGLLLTPRRQFLARMLPALLLYLLVAFGATKVFIGVERGKPVGFLVAYCVVVAVIGVFFSLKKPVRTWAGDLWLRRMRRDHASLAASARTNAAGLEPAHLGLAVGLFGASLLATGPLAAVHRMMATTGGGWSTAAAGSSGDGCGDSGCGSGSGCGAGGSGCGGGGGCGGCGGGGD